jgi:hypothetical protein
MVKVFIEISYFVIICHSIAVAIGHSRRSTTALTESSQCEVPPSVYEHRLPTMSFSWASELSPCHSHSNACSLQLQIPLPWLHYRSISLRHSAFVNYCLHFHWLRSPRRQINSVSFSPQTNYTDWATATSRRNFCQLLWIEKCRLVSATDPPQSLISVF